MTDTMMIRDCIRSQGMKLGHVAHVLGITNNTLRQAQLLPALPDAAG